MTKFLNISVDNTLGGNSPSDVVVSSQKAVKEYVDAHSGGGGSTAVDNLSITRNSSLQIQTVGVIDSNNTTNAIKTWTGTKAQYDAIVTKEPNTLYNITDDTSSVDIMQTILSSVYPVGSVYITTSNTCPLSTLIAGSTWTLISSGVVTSVDTNVPIKGTGKSLGLTNGTANFGMQTTSGAEGNINIFKTAVYNVNVSSTGIGTGNGVAGVYGVTTDASKSGIVGTVTRSTLSVNIWERTA